VRHHVSRLRPRVLKRSLQVAVLASSLVNARCDAAPADQTGTAEGLPATEWSHTSPHEVRMIDVGDGVELEVLDWGGDGVPLVFLAGSGMNAHAFDDFAPRFVEEHRVVGITRRGHGASSWPDSGYDPQTRVEDIRAVLDEVGIDEAILAGHSLGGEEITRFAVAHPERARGLIYIDGLLADADDHASRIAAIGAACPLSAEAYTVAQRDFVNPELVLNTQSTPGSSDPLDFWVGPQVQSRIMAGLSNLDYTQIPVPALAVAYVPRNGARELPLQDTPPTPECEKLWLGGIYEGIAKFLEEMPLPTLVALQDTQHNIHWVTPEALESAMQDWMRQQGFTE